MAHALIKSLRFPLVASFTLVSGCASIVDGSNQSLSVETIANGTSVAGAQCTL